MATIGSYSDERLNHTYAPPGGQAMTVVWLIENALIGHVREQTGSIQVAAESAGSVSPSVSEVADPSDE